MVLAIVIVMVFGSLLYSCLRYLSVTRRYEIRECEIKMDELELNLWNESYECESCNIVSRLYQFKKTCKCPHCEEIILMSRGNIEDDRNFPFAPKLSKKEFRKIKSQESKLKIIKEDMRKLEAYDKEIESWEKLQLKKLEELEAKANEIKVELAKGEGK